MEHNVPIGVRLARAFQEAFDELNLEGTAEALDGLRTVLCLEASVLGENDNEIAQLRSHLDTFELVHNTEVHKKSAQYRELHLQAQAQGEQEVAALFFEEIQKIQQLLRGKARSEFGLK